MKIKTTKEMNLPELIQYVWDENIKSDYGATQYQSNVNTIVEVDMSGQVSVLGKHYGNEVYTVPVTEELTEETVINGLADVFFDPTVGGPNVEYYADCIKNIKQDAMETYSLAVYYKDTLVWARESGIPEEGVIEL